MCRDQYLRRRSPQHGSTALGRPLRLVLLVSQGYLPTQCEAAMHAFPAAHRFLVFGAAANDGLSSQMSQSHSSAVSSAVVRLVEEDEECMHLVPRRQGRADSRDWSLRPHPHRQPHFSETRANKLGVRVPTIFEQTSPLAVPRGTDRSVCASPRCPHGTARQPGVEKDASKSCFSSLSSCTVFSSLRSNGTSPCAPRVCTRNIVRSGNAVVPFT